MQTSYSLASHIYAIMQNQLGRSNNESQRPNGNEGELSGTLSVLSSEAPAVTPSENLGIIDENSAAVENTETPYAGSTVTTDDVSGIPVSDNDAEKITTSVDNINATTENPRKIPETSTPSAHGTDSKDDYAGQKDKVVNDNASSKDGQDNLDLERVEGENISSEKDDDGALVPEASPTVKKNHDYKRESSSEKLLDQLDEVHIILHLF